MLAISSSDTFIATGKHNSASEVGYQCSSCDVDDASTWFHVVAVWSPPPANVYTIYVDGSSVTRSGTSGYGVGTNEGITLGIRNDYSLSDYTGNIDVVTIWRRELNTSEISEIYNSGNGRSCEYFYNTTTTGEPPIEEPKPTIFDEKWSESEINIGEQIQGMANVTITEGQIQSVIFEVMFPNGTRKNFTGTRVIYE
jgi:hypothetical protein